MLKSLKNKLASKKDKSQKSPTGSKGSQTNLEALITELPDFTKDDLAKPLTPFSEAQASEHMVLFIKKLRLCAVCFDWKDNVQKESGAKEVKRQTLLELIDFLGKNKACFEYPTVVEIINMVSINVFRALPPRLPKMIEPEEEEPVFEPAWPHLQIVYEFFLRFIVSNDLDVKVLKKYINSNFVLQILELFDSDDPRERDYLKTILHRIYAKFMSLRAFIRKAINNLFFKFIYEGERVKGVAELLEILGSIINGFAVPLKQEHKTFLTKVLIPMHKVKPLSLFQQQLSYCVTQFVDKDPSLAPVVIRGLVKFWPVTNSPKEVLFLNELEEILELTQAEDFQSIMTPLFQTLSKCIGSHHFQVAERVLFLWQNDYISGMISENREAILPIIFPMLQLNSQSHWNPNVNNLSVSILKNFLELDPGLVEKCEKKVNESAKELAETKKKREEIWSNMEEKAAPKKQEMKIETTKLHPIPESNNVEKSISKSAVSESKESTDSSAASETKTSS